jgi:DNA-binding NarL/FixJ family response regulator
MLKILIADDHPVVCRGLKQILAETPGFAMADEAHSGKEVLDKIRQKDYDVALLDIAMPDMNGVDVLKELRRQNPELPVLILSIYPEEQYAIRVLKAGASGYLTKDSAPDELTTAIQKVASGRRYISPSLADRLALNLQTNIEILPHEALSDREYQVMCLIASGKATGDIAKALSLSAKTISTYRAHILRKMQMKNNYELIRYVLQNGLSI